MAKSPSCVGEFSPLVMVKSRPQMPMNSPFAYRQIPPFFMVKSPIFSKKCLHPRPFPTPAPARWQLRMASPWLSGAPRCRGARLRDPPGSTMGWTSWKSKPFWVNEDWWFIYILCVYIYISNYKHHSFMMFYGVIAQLLTYSKMFKGSCYRPFKNNLHSERVRWALPSHKSACKPSWTSFACFNLSNTPDELGKAARKKHVEEMH